MTQEEQIKQLTEQLGVVQVRCNELLVAGSLNRYQSAAYEMAVYPTDVGLAYTALGLAGEAGELANKVKKVLRDHNGIVTAEYRDMIKEELGDCLWYVAAVAHELGVLLSDVAESNLKKLTDRKARGTLRGNGDNRWSVRTVHYFERSCVIFCVGSQRMTLFEEWQEKQSSKVKQQEEAESVKEYCEFMAKMFVKALNNLGLKSTRVRKGCARSK